MPVAYKWPTTPETGCQLPAFLPTPSSAGTWAHAWGGLWSGASTHRAIGWGPRCLRGCALALQASLYPGEGGIKLLIKKHHDGWRDYKGKETAKQLFFFCFLNKGPCKSSN